MGEDEMAAEANLGLLSSWESFERGCADPMTMSSLESFRTEGLRPEALLLL